MAVYYLLGSIDKLVLFVIIRYTYKGGFLMFNINSSSRFVSDQDYDT
nr:hypothetical protein CWKEJDCK_CWKEJDCK_CDS_0007 [Microvirus sp.]